MSASESRKVKTGAAFPNSVPQLYKSYDSGMSLREYAAIMLRVPDSGTEWLDEMIRKSYNPNC